MRSNGFEGDGAIRGRSAWARALSFRSRVGLYPLAPGGGTEPALRFRPGGHDPSRGAVLRSAVCEPPAIALGPAAFAAPSGAPTALRLGAARGSSALPAREGPGSWQPSFWLGEAESAEPALAV